MFTIIVKIYSSWEGDFFTLLSIAFLLNAPIIQNKKKKLLLLLKLVVYQLLLEITVIVDKTGRQPR